MSSITTAEIEKLAELSRISLTPEEKEKMRGEFEVILSYLASVNKISGNTEKGARSIIATENVMREDANPHETGLHTETLLSGAPRREGQYVKVKKIL